MSNTQASRRRLEEVKPQTLEQVRAQMFDALGVDAGMELPVDGADPVIVPHPLALDDDTQVAVENADSVIALATTVLGDAEYKRFRDAGGRANDVALAWATMRQRMQGTLPDGRPTRS